MKTVLLLLIKGNFIREINKLLHMEREKLAKGLKFLLPKFKEFDLEYVIVGGASLLIQGLDVITEDVDILVNDNKIGLSDLWEQLEREGIRASYLGPGKWDIKEEKPRIDIHPGMLNFKIEDISYFISTPQAYSYLKNISNSSEHDFEGIKVNCRPKTDIKEDLIERLKGTKEEDYDHKQREYARRITLIRD